MRRLTLTLIFVLLCSALPLVHTVRADTHEARTTIGPSTGVVRIVASGLTSPRGMTWGPDGTLYVALAGHGGATPGIPEVPPPSGPFRGGPTASVVRIEDGCPVGVAEGLPSTRDGQGGVNGVADLAMLDGHLYALVAAGGSPFGNPGTTNGVYRVNADGTTTLIADTSAWLTTNLRTVEGRPFGYLFAMVADEVAGALWVVDSNRGVVLTVSPNGTIALVADIWAEQPIPTGLTLAPEGGVYVGNLTPRPHPDGAAKIVHIAPDGRVTEVWTGLTALTGVAVGPDGDLYALELSTSNTAEPPFLQPHSGRVVRQTDKDRLEEVVTGLLFPVALDIGPDGALYVAQPAFGAHDGSGFIVRIEIGSTSRGLVPTLPVAADCPPPTTGA